MQPTREGFAFSYLYPVNRIPADYCELGRPDESRTPNNRLQHQPARAVTISIPFWDAPGVCTSFCQYLRPSSNLGIRDHGVLWKAVKRMFQLPNEENQGPYLTCLPYLTYAIRSYRVPPICYPILSPPFSYLNHYCIELSNIADHIALLQSAINSIHLAHNVFELARNVLGTATRSLSCSATRTRRS